MKAAIPYENESRFDGGDPELPGVIRLAVRGMQMCAHETYMDCPFYEQLMYDGDTRLELLTTYAMTRDDRLLKRALELFDFSRRNWGFVNERYPAYLPQQSPTFSLIWALMLNDYAYWRNDPAFVRARAIGLRSMLEQFEPYLNRTACWRSCQAGRSWTGCRNGIPATRRTAKGVSVPEQPLVRLCVAEVGGGGRVPGRTLLAQRLRGKAGADRGGGARQILGRRARADGGQPGAHRIQRARPVPGAALGYADRRAGPALL